MELDAQKLSAIDLYKILTASVLPRPIAWVSTLSADGESNLAPFSFFNVASVSPPVLCFSPLVNEEKKEKDTLVNIRSTGEFVVNIVSYDLVEKMNQTSAPYPCTESEFDKVGVLPEPSVMVGPPGVLDALARFECRLNQIISFGNDPMAGNLILGDIRHIHMHPSIYENGKVDFMKLDPVGRLSGNFYATIRDTFALPRPVV